ncbi:Unknown protein [Striga hermonthica]|uniref:Uncharacterized protein n=1 Tax=Striga hermonthica TaxID=68872 RepID=A0A9N7R2C4_STRHE|nr:Unknown protein [Striga hermonthica]
MTDSFPVLAVSSSLTTLKGFSKDLRTYLIMGRLFGSGLRQDLAITAMAHTSSKRSSSIISFGSTMLVTSSMSYRLMFNNVASNISFRFESLAELIPRLPVTSSSRTFPKQYTSYSRVSFITVPDQKFEVPVDERRITVVVQVSQALGNSPCYLPPRDPIQRPQSVHVIAVLLEIEGVREIPPRQVPVDVNSDENAPPFANPNRFTTTGSDIRQTKRSPELPRARRFRSLKLSVAMAIKRRGNLEIIPRSDGSGSGGSCSGLRKLLECSG